MIRVLSPIQCSLPSLQNHSPRHRTTVSSPRNIAPHCSCLIPRNQKTDRCITHRIGHLPAPYTSAGITLHPATK